MRSLLLLSLWAVSTLTAATSESARFEIPYLRQAPTLEAILAEPPASGSLRPDIEPGIKLDGFVQREPRDGAAPSRKTTVYLSRDERNLYVVFLCQTPRPEIRAHLSKRDQIGEDDSVGVFLDTSDERRGAYFFYANPLGVQMDGITKEGQGEDASFDTVWATRGQLTSTGYAVLFAIPFRSIRSSAAEAGSWGIAFTRFSPHTNELVTWPRIPRGREGFVPHFASFTPPAHGQSSRLPMTFTPYVFAAGPGNSTRAGMDAQIAIRNQFNLDLTIHPDFSQVEADDPRNTVNQRFEVFFPEKRTFFRDHANFFQTPETLFFSRRILRPTAGVRLSGAASGWSTGLLALEDRDAEGNASRIGVARIERAFRSNGSLGAIFLRRSDAFGENNVAAIDGRWRFRNHWAATAQVTRTTSRFRSGNSSYFDIRRTGNNFHFSSTYRERSPGFEDELGYIPRVNIRQLQGTTGYTFRPESGSVLGVGPSLSWMMNRDYTTGRLLDWSVGVPLWIDLTRSTAVALEREQSYETYTGQGFRKHAQSVYFTSDPQPWIGFYGSHRQGTGVNYDPVPGLRPFLGAQHDQTAGLSLRPGAKMRIDQMFLRSGLSAEGSPVYESRMYRLKVQYQFTREFSIRVIGDRNLLSFDETRFDPESSGAPMRRFGYDFLAAWQSMSGWSFYAGYSNRQQRWDLAEQRTGAIGYVKINYQWRP